MPLGAETETETSVWGWLVLEPDFTDRDLKTAVHPLSEEEHTVGRDLNVSIVLGEELCRGLVEEVTQDGDKEDPHNLSRQHFLVRKPVGDEVAVLTDLSTNGTWVNGVKVGQDRQMILQHNTSISLLGPNHKVFQYLDQATMDSLYPRQITSRYLVSDFLGTGSTATVYKAFKNWNNNKDLETVALKIIRTESSDSQYVMPKNLMKEVNIQKCLNHPSLVKLKEVISTVDMLVLVMELVKGGDLFDQIINGGGQPRLRSEMEVKVQFYQLAHCVRYLHRRKISHRDLKLENILVASSSCPRVKITDFGLAKVTSCSFVFLLLNMMLKVYSSTNPLKTYAGTPSYMAPEVSMLEKKEFRRMGGTYNQKADCWSLGVILYTMLSGSVAFPDGSDQLQRILSGRYRPMTGYRWAGISKEAKDLISSLLEVKVERRLSSEQILQHPWISRDELVVNIARKIMSSEED